jgi:hypothetical protein
VANYEQVARRWYERTQGSAKNRLYNPRMIDVGDAIQSYGDHFELGRAIRGTKDEVILYLLNGDNYSVTTSGHQRVIRDVVGWGASPSVIIPYTVLNSAGIRPADVRLLEATADHDEIIRHTAANLTDVPMKRQDAVEPLADILADNHDRYGGRATPRVDEDGFPVDKWDWLVTFDGTTYRWVTFRHWLGESLIGATIRYSVVCKAYRPAHYDNPHPQHYNANRAEDWPGWKDEAVYEAARQEYVAAMSAYNSGYHPASCSRHGDRCGGRIRRSRQVKFLSGFDHNEERRSYFFCELPKTNAVTVADAYKALKPDTVSFAEVLGRDVKRQGDIFAIALGVNTRTLTKAGAVITKGGHVFSTDHEATELAVLPDGTTLARGCLRHNPRFRRPDHARLTLGREWHVLVKNTVPLSA